MDTLLHTPDTYLVAAFVWTMCGACSLFVLLNWLRRRKRRSLRLHVVHAGLSIWCLLFALTVAEFAFAIWYDNTDSIMLTNASARWVDIHVTYNNAGFRDEPLELAPLRKSPSDNRMRVAFAGDSFTFGHGIKNVEDRFSDIIRAKLEQEGQLNAGVANLGLLGAGIDRIIDVVHLQFQAGMSVDTVVYVYCLNDIERFDSKLADSLFWDIGRSRPSFFLFRDTYFFNFMYFRFRQYQLPAIRDYYGFVRKLYEPDHFKVLASKLNRFRSICHDYGAELRIAVFPFVHNIGSDYPFLGAHEKLVRYCEAESIAVLDLEPVLRQFAPARLMVNPYDAHPNEFANQLVARAMLHPDSGLVRIRDND